MNNLHIVCLTKSYNRDDFVSWYRWYKNLGVDFIHVFDNESSVEIEDVIEGQDTYEKVVGWPNQWHLFSDILNGNRFKLDDGDYIFFADDDEFVWFDKVNFNDIKSLITQEFEKTQLDILMLPQILMSSKKLLPNRTKPYIETNYYRRADLSSQGKALIRYFHDVEYNFSKRNREVGHIPFYRMRGTTEWLRYSKVIGSDISKTTYGLTDYNADLRLYHFHLKSEEDWEMKWKRGSAACQEHPYKEKIEENFYYGNYNVIDASVFLEIEKNKNEKEI